MDLEKIEAQTNGGRVEVRFEGEELQIYLNGQLRTTMTFDSANTVTVNHHVSEE